MELFAPSNNPMRVDYPILKNIDEFKRLGDAELLFVWYYACKSSPIYGTPKKDKALAAIKLIPGFANKLSEGEYERYVDGDFPPNITEAIKVMERFEPEVRLMAKTFTDRILSKIDYVTTMDVELYKEVGDIKTFMDMQINIAKNLPDIVAAAEHGYGFKKAKEKESHKREGILDE